MSLLWAGCCEEGGCTTATYTDATTANPPPGFTEIHGTNWDKPGASNAITSNESNALLLFNDPSPLDADGNCSIAMGVILTQSSSTATDISKAGIFVNYTDDNNYHFFLYYRDLARTDAGVIELWARVGGTDTLLSQCGCNRDSTMDLEVYFGNGRFGARPQSGSHNASVPSIGYDFTDNNSSFNGKAGIQGIGINERSLGIAGQGTGGIVWVEATGTGTGFGYLTRAVAAGDTVKFESSGFGARDTSTDLTVLARKFYHRALSATVLCPEFYTLCWWICNFPPNDGGISTLSKSWEVVSGTAVNVDGSYTSPGTVISASGHVRALTAAPSATIRGWVYTSGIYNSGGSGSPAAGDNITVRLHFNSNSYIEQSFTLTAYTAGVTWNWSLVRKLYANGGLLATATTTGTVPAGGFDPYVSPVGRIFPDNQICYDGTTLSAGAGPTMLSGTATLTSFVPAVVTTNAPYSGVTVINLRAGYDSTLHPGKNPRCNLCSHICAGVTTSPNVFGVVYLRWTGLGDTTGASACAAGVCDDLNGQNIVTEQDSESSTNCDWIFEGPLPTACGGATAYRATARIFYSASHYWLQATLEWLDGFDLVGDWRYDLGTTKPTVAGIGTKTLTLYSAGGGFCDVAGSTVTFIATA